MAEAARVLEFPDEYIYGTAIPARQPDAVPLPAADSPEEELQRQRERVRTAAAQNVPGISMFAILGSVFVSILMIFTILAQISYNEVASETVRLNTQINNLAEQERLLEIAFDSVVDMKEVERYARDVLGMSKPENEQVAVIKSVQADTAEIIRDGAEANPLSGLGSFISSLTEYFKR